MIIDGYGSLDAIETIGRRYGCECHRDKNGLITSDSFFDDGVGAFVPGWHCCEIHNRNDGYLKRLHQRLIRFAGNQTISRLIIHGAGHKIEPFEFEL